MVKKENDYFGYNTMEFREFVFEYLLIQFITLTIDQFIYDHLYYAQYLYVLMNFSFFILFCNQILILPDGFISLRYSNYRRLDMEKHLASVLEQRFSNQSFDRQQKKKHKTVDKDVKISNRKNKTRLSQAQGSLQVSLLEKPSSKTERDQMTTPQFTAHFNSENRASESQYYNHPVVNTFSRFSVQSTNEENGLKQFTILYFQNSEPKTSIRNIIEISSFIKMLSKRIVTAPMRQLEGLILEIDRDITKFDKTQLSLILNLIQQDENLECQFGYFLQAKSPQIWFSQYQALVLGKYVDSFAPKQVKSSMLNEKEVQSSAEYFYDEPAEKDKDEYKYNVIQVNSFDVKQNKTRLQIVYFNQSGQKFHFSRQNSELQQIITQILNNVSLPQETYDVLCLYTNNVIDEIKLHLESQLTAVLQKEEQHSQITEKLRVLLSK